MPLSAIARWLLHQAYRAGYARGHNDTVEGSYNGCCEYENDCADEWINEMLDHYHLEDIFNKKD